MGFLKSRRSLTSRSASTAAPPIDVNDDLNKVWAHALAEFQRITNTALPSGSTPIIELRDQMFSTINQGPSKNKALAKRILSNSLTLLQNFGTILASTSSAAFPATGQCWSAISMVIGAAQSYHRILDGFVTLLERCLAFLEELFFFLDKKQKEGETLYLDVHIRGPAYEILALFLTVVASSYRLSRSKCEKMKVFLEVFLFNSDAGLAEYLALFEEKVRQLTNRKVDVILQDVKGLAKYMVASDEERDRHFKEINEALNRTGEAVGRIENITLDIKENQEREMAKQEKRANLEFIRGKLSIGQDQKPWKEQQQKIGVDRVPNTGIWLLRGNVVFRRWTNVSNDAVGAITLTGKSGYGKSFLCSAVISYLLDTYARDALEEQRVCVAYYFRGNERQMSLGVCLRSLIYQIASEDAEFCEEMAKALKKGGEFAQVKELWKLVAGGPLKNLHGKTYFLCIDGYRSSKEDRRDDEALAEIVRSAMLKEHSVAIRLFVSTESEDLVRIPFEDAARPPDISLGLPRKTTPSRDRGAALDIHADGTLADGQLPNQDDLVRVARFRMDSLCRAKPDLANLLDGIGFDVAERLAIAARGYYAKLDSKLRQINDCESEERVKDIINRADDDMETTLKESIIALNASLTENDIEHLNEILVWIIGGRTPIHVDLLQAALYLAVGQNFMLRTVIDLKYSTLLKVDEHGFVVLQSDDLEPILRSTGAAPNAADFSKNKDLLHASEIDLVDRFVRNVCGDDLYRRFDFSVFFNVKRGKKDTSIGVGSQNSLNIRILHRCLTALSTKKDDRRVARLREYAATQWFKHMEDVENLSEADKALLGEIRSGLVAVLSDPKSIEIWWDPIRWESQEYLVAGSHCIDALLKILVTEDIASSYGEPSDAEWVRSITVEDGKRQHIFYHLALHLARKWFSLGYYRTKLFSPKLFMLAYTMMRSEFDYDSSRGDVNNMKAFMLWARQHIDMEIDEAHWKYAEGCTFMSYGKLNLGLDALRAADELIPDKHNLWGIPAYIADIHWAQREYTEAIQRSIQFRALKSSVVGTGRGPLEEQNYLEEHCTSYLRDAECYKQLGDFEAAASAYQTVMENTVFWETRRNRDMHAVAAGSLFALWADKQDHASILEMMQAWRRGADGAKGIKYWLCKMALNEAFHSHIRRATMRTGQHQEVIEMYRYVVDEATDAPDDDSLNALYHYYASLLYHVSPNEKDHDVATEYWKDLLSTLRAQVGSTGVIEFDALSATVQRCLCRALIDKAVAEAGHASDEVASQLRALITEDEYALPQPQNTVDDPRITLTTLLTLQGKSEEAHSVAHTMFRSMLEKWPDSDDEVVDCYRALTCLLSAVDDTDNAIAAWHAASRPVTCQCCEQSWPDESIFLCKQCLARWLCTHCHSSLLSDALDPEICSKKHRFLEIPACDSSEWERIRDGMVRVGESFVPRYVWADGLRVQWNVTEEQLARRRAEEEAEARASEIINRRVSGWWKRSRK